MSGLKPYVESVWSLLLKHCECQEEGTRNVVAECLGKLTLIDPETLLPRLKGYLLSGHYYSSDNFIENTQVFKQQQSMKNKKQKQSAGEFKDDIIKKTFGKRIVQEAFNMNLCEIVNLCVCRFVVRQELRGNGSKVHHL